MSSDLQIGLSGILASQRAMLVAGHNISNANTKGYSRQTASFVTRPSVATSAGTLGQGVDLSKIARQTDAYINSRLRENTSSLGSASVKSQYLRELETVFNETSDFSLNNAMSSFFKGINDLSQNPELMGTRSTLLEQSNTLTDTFHRLSDELSQMKTFIYQGAQNKVSDVNELTAGIADVNDQISGLNVKGIQANDLLDKRESLLQDLSKLINFTTINQKDGTVDVMAAGGSLVLGRKSMDLAYEVDSLGNLNITDTGKMTKFIFKNGELKGLQNLYNTTLVNYKSKLDTLATSLIKEVNKVHSEGVGLSGGFTSVRSSNAVSSTTTALGSAGLPYAPTKGDLYITVINTATGAVTKNKVYSNVDVATKTLAGVVSDINATTSGSAGNITAYTVDNKLKINAASGYKFNFSYALDPNPGSLGTSTATAFGSYSGQSNDVYTFKALGTGTIGTTSGLQVEVKDSSGAVVATLDVGSTYTAGNTINVANGVSLSLASGAITAGNSFNLDVIKDSDSTNLLGALGVNSYFTGTSASNIAVTKEVSEDVSLIAASTGEIGDNTNALRLAALQDDTGTTNGTTFADYLHQTASALGEEVSNANKSEDTFNALDTSLGNRRNEVSGVSIDEELVNLVRYQQAYQASSKYISIANQLTEKLLNSF